MSPRIKCILADKELVSGHINAGSCLKIKAAIHRLNELLFGKCGSPGKEILLQAIDLSLKVEQSFLNGMHVVGSGIKLESDLSEIVVQHGKDVVEAGVNAIETGIHVAMEVIDLFAQFLDLLQDYLIGRGAAVSKQ